MIPYYIEKIENFKIKTSGRKTVYKNIYKYIDVLKESKINEETMYTNYKIKAHKNSIKLK